MEKIVAVRKEMGMNQCLPNDETAPWEHIDVSFRSCHTNIVWWPNRAQEEKEIGVRSQQECPSMAPQ